ncbi:MAG: transcription antitermination protein NusB [Solirubrobacteraceae bacterium]
MSRRSEQRRDAVFAVYQSDLTNRELSEVLDRRATAFTRSLAHATVDRAPELDALISKYAKNWSIDRIAPLEKATLRVALLEMLHPDAAIGDTPIAPEGAIDEAVELVKVYAADKSGSFVNGILSAALKDLKAGTLT